MSGAKSFAGASAAVPASTPLLDIQDVSKGFTLHAAGRRVSGCEHISMRVGHGEFVGVTGRSGSGKSTILKCIYRTNLPESGKILYDSAAFGVRLGDAG